MGKTSRSGSTKMMVFLSCCSLCSTARTKLSGVGGERAPDQALAVLAEQVPALPRDRASMCCEQRPKKDAPVPALGCWHASLLHRHLAAAGSWGSGSFARRFRPCPLLADERVYFMGGGA